jgi:hypothetical protein
MMMTGKIIIHWQGESPPMEIPHATYKGADSQIIKISTGDKEYWFNWDLCWYIEMEPDR